MKVDIIHDESELYEFCNECDRLGYHNNSSIKLMKYQWCKENGEYWGAWYNNRLIAVAGAHLLPEVSKTAVRVLFRGCQIYSPHKTLNSCHMNSVPFGNILPYQIEKFYNYDLYTTTNINHDASGKMNRTHRVMHYLDKKGIVEYSHDMYLKGVDQSVWLINKDVYLDLRTKLRGSF